MFSTVASRRTSADFPEVEGLLLPSEFVGESEHSALAGRDQFSLVDPGAGRDEVEEGAGRLVEDRRKEEAHRERIRGGREVDQQHRR